RVDPTSVLLAAFAVTLAARTRCHPVVVQMLVSNRFRPGFADTVSPIAQPGLCVLDIAGIPFDAAIDRARRASLVASKHAYYDPDQRDRLIASAERDRGTDIDLSCFFNHRTRLAAEPPAIADADELRDAPGRGELACRHRVPCSRHGVAAGDQRADATGRRCLTTTDGLESSS
ncbi:MAG TPA: hypothetical protein VF892_11545, partial [Pseudonocardiaceae bacterium]